MITQVTRSDISIIKNQLLYIKYFHPIPTSMDGINVNLHPGPESVQAQNDLM